MPDRNPELEHLAERIGELRSIDWEKATREIRLEPDSSVGENLRILARIASFESDAVDGESTPRSWGPLELGERITVDEEGERWSARDGTGEELELLWPPSHHHDPGHARVELVSAARAMVGLQAPEVVEVLGADAFEGRLGIWMRAVRGRTLEEWVRAEGAPPPSALRAWVGRLCRGVEAIHERRRFLHALPPSGVIVDDDRRLRIRRLPHLRSAAELRAEEHLPPLSAYHFAAPECLSGAAPTAPADVFTIAALLCWTVGEDPRLQTFDTVSGLRAHRARALRLDRLPPGAAALLRECLHAEPGRRPEHPAVLRQRWEGVMAALEPEAWQRAEQGSLWSSLRRRLPFS